MVPLDPESARELLEAMIAAFSFLGGGMAYLSGRYAAQALAQQRPSAFVAQRVNEGLGEGFKLGSSLAIVAFIIMVWS